MASKAKREYDKGKAATGMEHGLLQHLGRVVVASYASTVQDMEDEKNEEIAALQDELEEVKGELERVEEKLKSKRRKIEMIMDTIESIGDFKHMSFSTCRECDSFEVKRKDGKESAYYGRELRRCFKCFSTRCTKHIGGHKCTK
jgi:seryl-tRNA synthetase